jgi:hypothetical protein
MKTIKISLAVIVVAIITFFAMRSFVSTGKVGDIQLSGNPFVDKIQQEIKVLQVKPENKFCNDFHANVVYQIEEFHRNGKLGKNTSENNQWKENLSKQLYAAYTDKFIKQAYYVFNQSEWTTSDLGLIRNEYRALQSSALLERNTLIDRRFNDIKIIFNKYDEITSFISSCKSFSFTQLGLDIPFPFDDVKNKISAANSYKNNKLGNSYVNNCTRLHKELNEIPKVLFRAHVGYLDKMISDYSNQYKDYSSQKTYVTNIYRRVENKIDELDNDIYKVSVFSDEYSRLKNKWATDGTNAYNHFNN